MPLPRSRVEVPQKLITNASLLALLALVVVTITALYISNEHNLHWWVDWYAATIQIADAFRTSPSEAIQLVQVSLSQERNRLYTLPLLPFILAFGNSRLVYEISLALVYLLPLSLAMGAIATQLIRFHQQTVFWSTALLTLLIPVSWVPTLMGIPDTGGALFIALATFVYLQDVRLKRWWRIPLMGCLIGLGILLRRHFIYGGIAIFGAVSLQALLFFASEVRDITQKQRFMSRLATFKTVGLYGDAWRNLLLTGVKIGLIATTTVTTLMTVAPEFTYRAVTTDYRSLYTSWTLPFGDIVNLYAAFYGWVTWLMVILGFSASILTRTLPLSAVSLIGLSGILSLIAWLVILRYANIFYALHTTPLVIIGLVALVWTTWIRLTGTIRLFILSLVGCYLVSNLIMGLTPIGTFNSPLRPLFALSTPPLVRTDYDQVVRLVNYLRQLAPNQEPIYVVGNQRLQLDSSLVKSTESLLYGQKGKILNILGVPKVDSRDAYPIETLLQAQYVVVPNPLPEYLGNPTQVPAVGEWLPNQELDVVTVVFDAFTQNWDIAQDFQRLPVEFTLERGAKVSIYQRIRPTSLETAVQTFYAMQQQIGERPGGQSDWLILSQGVEQSLVIKNPDATYKLITHQRDRTFAKLPHSTQKSDRPQPAPKTTFLYLGALPEKAEVTGKITFLDNPCISASLRLAMLNPEGQIVSSTEHQYSVPGISSFQLSLSGENSAYLLLAAQSYDQNHSVRSCTMVINSLTVSPQP